VKVLSVVLFALAGSQLPAGAENWVGATGNFGQCVGANRADKNSMTFYYSDLRSDVRSAADWVKDERVVVVVVVVV
jgi:hypothetical protein